jgi:maltose/moltooligosaccharide transporter
MTTGFPPDSTPAPNTAAVLRALAPLIAIQFACWTGMFLMWIGAYPVITLAIMPAAPGDPASLRRPLLALAGCFSWYALLAALLAFLIPAALRRLPAPVLLGLCALVGALGLASLGWIASPAWLPLSFTALAVGWAALSNLPYTIAGRLVPGQRIDHAFRLFALAGIAPQIAVSLALVFVIGEIDVGTARRIMLAAGAAMALGGAGALLLRRRLAGAPSETGT